MDFNSIVLYLKATGMNVREIHSDLVATLGTKVSGYSTAARWLRGSLAAPKRRTVQFNKAYCSTIAS
jgi:hypothetical protein